MLQPCVLATVSLCLATLLHPASVRAACGGDCGAELAAKPTAVERYLKARWGALSRCAQRGSPLCPTACAAPDATAAPFSLSSTCADLLDCRVDELAELAYATTWNGAAFCPFAPATACGRARGKGAGYLVVKRLERRRTSRMDRLPRDVARCELRVERGGACGASTLCGTVGDWVDTLLPVTLTKKGYQSLPFTVAAGEVIATVTLTADSADWGALGRESVVVEYDVDGTVTGTIVVYDGAEPADYRILLGDLAAGSHRLGLRHQSRLSPASDSTVIIQQAVSAEAIPPADPRYDFTRFAPVLLGIDTKLNSIGVLPGNAASDVPLIMYTKRIPGSGITTYRYVMIWSNEDLGTGLFPYLLLAQWGRSADIETIVEVDVTDAGTLAVVRYRPDESGSLASFAGAFQGTHPIVRTATANGLIADDGASTLRFAPVPTEFDDSGVPREKAMDLDVVSYRVMAKEMIREGKTEEPGDPGTIRPSDLRNYLFLDYDIDTDASGRVLRGVAVVNGTPYASDHFVTSFNVALNPRVRDGVGRTAIELPPGTAIGDIQQFGIQGVGTMSGTLYDLDAFILQTDFLPGAHITFSGALVASGVSPFWLVAP